MDKTKQHCIRSKVEFKLTVVIEHPVSCNDSLQLIEDFTLGLAREMAETVLRDIRDGEGICHPDRVVKGTRRMKNFDLDGGKLKNLSLLGEDFSEQYDATERFLPDRKGDDG